MAKTSKIVKNNQRKRTIGVYSDRRQELLKIIKDPNTSYDEKREAQKKIAKMPRDASPTRHRNRCEVCLLYTSPSPRDRSISRMPSSA